MRRKLYGTQGLGRVDVGVDPRSLEYPVSKLIGEEAYEGLRNIGRRINVLSTVPTMTEVPPRLKTVSHHRFRWNADQGDTPMCTAYAAVKLLGGGPVPQKGLMAKNAQQLVDILYAETQKQDRLMGNYFSDGATMLALGRAGKVLGLWRSYNWGTSSTDFVAAIPTNGVLFGIDWNEGCDGADPKWGMARWMGTVRGGHCFYADGWEPVFGYPRNDQTWGEENFGDANGYWHWTLADMDRALAAGGEMMIVDEIAGSAARVITG